MRQQRKAYMKKIMIIILSLVFLVPTQLYAQNKQLEKARKKQAKEKIKEIKKDKWKIFGTTRTLEVSLLEHYDKLNKGGADIYEMIGTADNFKSKNIGRQVCLNNVCNEYAMKAGSKVKGLIISDAHFDAIKDAEFDKFYAAYKTNVEKELKGEIQESFSVIKENKDGTCSMQIFYTIDESQAHRARMKALQNAFEESEAAQKYAEKISKFIEEGFNPAD